MNMSGEMAAICVLSAIVAVFAVCWLLRKDTKIEGQRGDAVDLTATLKAAGFTRGTELAKAYAIGDYSGLVVQTRQLAKDLNDPTQVGDILKGPFKLQLPGLLKNAEDRTWIFAAIDQYNAAFRPEEKLPPVGA